MADRTGRPRRRHAAASARVIVTAIVTSVFVVLMSLMGPFLRVDDISTPVATVGSDLASQPIVVQIRRPVAGAPPAPDPALPASLTVSAEPAPILPAAAEAGSDEIDSSSPAPTVAVAAAPAPPPRTSASG